jgi:hypothetical protein
MSEPFLLLRIDMVQGADSAALESKIKQYYTDAAQEEDTGVKGFVRNNNSATLST